MHKVGEISMDNLYFHNFEDFACEIADKFVLLDEYEDVAVIAKYNETKELFKELIYIGFDMCNISLEIPDWDGYDDEYILSLSSEGIWIEKFKRENDYFEDESTIIYILDNCSSKVIPYCKGETVYEVSIGDVESDDEENYTINGKFVSKEEFDEYVSQFKKNDEESDNDSSDDNSTYHITIKGNLDIGDAEKIIENMKRRMMHMQDIFDEMSYFRRLFMW